MTYKHSKIDQLGCELVLQGWKGLPKLSEPPSRLSLSNFALEVAGPGYLGLILSDLRNFSSWVVSSNRT